MLWILVSVAVILGLAYWVTRRVAGSAALSGFRAGGAKRGIEVLSRLALGKDKMLLIVRAGKRCFLLGVSAGSITTLAEFTQEEAAYWSEPEEEGKQGEKPDFREVLRGIVQRKERR